MKFLDRLLNLVYPQDVACIFCGEELNKNVGNLTCDECFEKLPFINKACLRCGVSLDTDKQEVCLHCKKYNYSFDFACAVFDYKDSIINVVHRFKMTGEKWLAKPLANFLVDKFSLLNIDADIVCAVPIYKTKLKERGFNQSELLAKEFCNKLKLPYLDLCVKVKDCADQKDLDFLTRRENVKDVFEFNKVHKKVIKGKNILLIDDVFTTGATSDAVSSVLKKAGAKSVFVLTLAHTPLPEGMKEEK